MADPDGKPVDPKDPRYNAPAAPAPVAPAPRVNPPNVNSAKESAPGDAAPPGFGDFLAWMRAFSGNETPPAEAKTGAAQRSLIPKEKKKFQRQDTEAKTEKPAPAPVTPAAPAERTERAAVPAAPPPSVEAAAPAAPVETPPALPVVPGELTPRVRRNQAAQKRGGWLWIGLQVGLLALLAGSFFLGRASVPKTAPVPQAAPAAPVIVTEDGKTSTTLLSDQNASLIDQAMAAEQGNDKAHFKQAEELLLKVKNSGEHVAGLDYQLALLAVYNEDSDKAFPLLNQSIAQGEEMAASYNLRGTLNSRLTHGQKGAFDFDTATKLAPFDARYFFYWGEAMRRNGRTQAALVKLQQAFDRLREPSLENLYRLKIRLALIELGQEGQFADEVAREVAQPYPSMDALIAAAALEMHRGKFAVAAEYLDRALRCGDPEAFTSRMRDFLLDQFRFQPELRRFYAAAPQLPPAAGPGATPTPPAAGGSPTPTPTPTPADVVAPSMSLGMPPGPSPTLPPLAPPR